MLTKIDNAFIEEIRVMPNKEAVTSVFPLAELERHSAPDLGGWLWSFKTNTSADKKIGDFVTPKGTDDAWRRAKVQVVRWLQDNLGGDVDQTGQLHKDKKAAKVAKDIKFDTDPSAISPTLFAVDLLNAMGARKAVQLLNPKAKVEWQYPHAKEGTSLGACTMYVFALEEVNGTILGIEGRWIEALNEQTLYNRAWAFIRGQILAFGMTYFDELVKQENFVEEDGDEGEGDDEPNPFALSDRMGITRGPRKAKAAKPDQQQQIPGKVIHHVLRRAAFYQGYDREALLGRLIQVEAELATAKGEAS